MRVDESTYNDLVSAFYDASLDAAGWPDALTRASDALSAIGAIYISLDFRRPECSQYELGRLDPDLMQPYLARHCRNDPWTRITTSMQVGATCALDAFVPATVLVQS